MEYPDLRYPKMDISYIPQKDVLDYLNKYAETFDLFQNIKVIDFLSIMLIKRFTLLIVKLPGDKHQTNLQQQMECDNKEHSK